MVLFLYSIYATQSSLGGEVRCANTLEHALLLLLRLRVGTLCWQRDSGDTERPTCQAQF